MASARRSGERSSPLTLALSATAALHQALPTTAVLESGERDRGRLDEVRVLRYAPCWVRSSPAIFQRERARRLALAALVGIGVALVLHFGLWHCPVAELFGVPCPGCGLTRAAVLLFGLELRRAFELHPLSPLLVPWALLAFGAALLRFVRGARLQPPRAELLALLLLVALIAVWISRFFGAFGGPVRVASHLG